MSHDLDSPVDAVGVGLFLCVGLVEWAEGVSADTHYRFAKFATKLYKGQRGLNGARVWVTRRICDCHWVASSKTLLARPSNRVTCAMCMVCLDQWLEQGNGKPLTLRRWRALIYAASRAAKSKQRSFEAPP